ncbi:dystrotelin isoform X1 [Pelodiscus sinensis]|uniref:dystrotelin isoform X1 n=1 Tax=Pelodiscus sinensis TaxID=13735 RepID=UPI003F6CAA90
MDPHQQEALNEVQNTIYRTALKLRTVQILCQLGWTDVSLIQHILPSRQCQEKQNSLTTQQLLQLLKELFQKAKLENPGQVDPQGPEHTLNLIVSMYDRSGTGFIKARSAATALIALSGDSLLTKYKAFFQLYADPSGRETLITQSAMKSLLTDLHQIPAAVGESCGLSCVEIAIQSCFHGVLNSAIGEEKFLSWLRSEPGLLLWLPTCHRLSATERVTHHIRCSICKSFPITGLRYRCLKCLNFDLCQVCFFTERHSKPHKRSHPVMECCVQMSAKENAKVFFRTVRNNLLPERCRRKEAQRRQTLEIFWEISSLRHAQALPSAELCISPQPAHRYLASPAYRPTPGVPKHLAEKSPAVQHIENDNWAPVQDKTSAQTIASIKAELLKAHESIRVLHSEKRYLRKQLNKWKDKMLLLHNTQDDKTCQQEALLQVLIANHESTQAELQQMRLEIKAMLQPPNQSSFVLLQNMMPKSEDLWEERKLHSGSDSALAKPMPTSCTEWKSLSRSSAEKRQLPQTQTKPVAMNPGSSGTALGSTLLQNGNPLMREHEKSKEKGIPQTDWEGKSQPENASNLPQGIMPRACSPIAAEVPFNEKEMSEEEELKKLLLKLKDALCLQLQPAQQSATKHNLLSTSGHVCRSFSDLINHVTLPAWK